VRNLLESQRNICGSHPASDVLAKYHAGKLSRYIDDFHYQIGRIFRVEHLTQEALP
jgi:hypothetical protein